LATEVLKGALRLSAPEPVRWDFDFSERVFLYSNISGNVPKLRICSVGIEKIIPKDEHLAVFIRLLTRSATGMPITQYTSHFRAPREGGEMHVVLVDNGRSDRLGMEKFWPSLKCIRCGACMNTCPVYRRSGGLSYGSTYMGPIGIIMMPTFDIRRYSELPFASTLNGSCSNVCPVKINIHEQIYAWRAVMDEKHQTKFPKKEAMIVAGKLLSHPEAYRIATQSTEIALKALPRFAIYNHFNVWGRHREVPAPADETFHEWYRKHRST
jgi:L-lactate dehydrogenase complex protein LldF